jgi:hypothetical protein
MAAQLKLYLLEWWGEGTLGEGGVPNHGALLQQGAACEQALVWILLGRITCASCCARRARGLEVGFTSAALPQGEAPPLGPCPHLAPAAVGGTRWTCTRVLPEYCPI